MEENWNLVQNMNSLKNTQYLILIGKLRGLFESYMKKKYCKISRVHIIKLQSSMIDKSINNSKNDDI